MGQVSYKKRVPLASEKVLSCIYNLCSSLELTVDFGEKLEREQSSASLVGLAVSITLFSIFREREREELGEKTAPTHQRG